MRALMIPIGVGYGTTARNLAVANEMTRRGHEAVFAAGDDLAPVIRQHGYEAMAIPDVSIDPRSKRSIPEQAFLQQVAPGFLERLLHEIIAAIRDRRVDVVVYSHNNMASLAAAKANVPSVSIFHPAILEMKTLTMLYAAYRKWRKWGIMAKAANATRKVVSPLFGDLNFIPSLPQLVKWPLLLSPEMYGARESARPVGALPVRRVDELPDREALRCEYVAGDGPFVYATVGGAVLDVRFLEALVETFGRTGYRAFITAGAQTPADVCRRLTQDGVTVVQYVPEAIRLIKACDVLVWHGGHETMMEAVATGRPGVVIPQHYDQNTNATLFAGTGAGITIPKRKLTPERLAEAAGAVLASPTYRHSAERLRRQSEVLGGSGRIVDEIEQILEK